MRYIRCVSLVTLFLLYSGDAFALPGAYPHSTASNVTCSSCHSVYSDEPRLIPPALLHEPASLDDTKLNQLCLSCHDDTVAPQVATHSSLTTDNGYGDWSIECVGCHAPHDQPQFRLYGSDAYLASGVTSAITTDTPPGHTTISVDGTTWSDGAFVGLTLVPNLSVDHFSYKVVANSSDTLTVTGVLDPAVAAPGGAFAVIYGKLVRTDIETPNSGQRSVKFVGLGAPNYYADGDGVYDGICEVCHTQTTYHRNDAAEDHAHYVSQGCTSCHRHSNGFRPGGGAAHEITGPGSSTCGNCHRGSLEQTHSNDCDRCHTADLSATILGAYGTWDGECQTCHDGVIAIIPHSQGGCSGCHDQPQGARRQILGPGGDFTARSHHVEGTPADSACVACHDLSEHGSGVVFVKDPDSGSRLTYDPADPATLEILCVSCHDADGAAAGGGLDPFGDGHGPANIESTWFGSAHERIGFAANGGNPISCYGDGSNSGCHGNAHGSDNVKLLNTAAAGVQPIEESCLNCHTEGVIQNNALSGPVDDIEEAFGTSQRHDVGTATFSSGANTYDLSCTTCHNPHVVTGKHFDADEPGVSPVTLPDLTADPATNPRAMGTTLWGDEPGEKMADYAANGAYRAPTGDSLAATQIPDYASFCQTCHEQSGPQPFGLDWVADPHGNQSANSPNGGGACPDWYGCGKGEGWSGDDCIGTEETCWPVLPRGRGDQLFSRKPYSHEERIAGANFVLSCTDCHESHGSAQSSMLRDQVNNGPGTSIWNTMCNNCHYYYSDWHAGMSCGTASCHTSNSIHRMGAKYGSSATRLFQQDLVLDMRFDANLNDSGSFRLHGRWFDAVAGSFVQGRFGSAIELDGTNSVQVGTRNEYWSTDAGRHGTWVYTEMKYNTTLEAWVNPTDALNREHLIFSRHVGWQQGGYALALEEIEGLTRAALLINVTGDTDGVRGAYSRTSVPLNTWTHVAATFDTTGPDRDGADPSVGRIRLYVNGEDVTTSDASGVYLQPGPGETAIFPYSSHSPLNESICYAAHWCASEFSVGGFPGWQNEFIGRIDEAKVWNVSLGAAYFKTADTQSAPRIDSVRLVSASRLLVTFTEGVAPVGVDEVLVASDFVLACGGRSITAVSHTPNGATATLTLGTPVTLSELSTCTVSVAASAVRDEYDNVAEPTAVQVLPPVACPPSPVRLDLNEASGSNAVTDDRGMLFGEVFGAGTLDGSAYVGDGVNNFIDFENNTNCLLASRKMTLEARLRPAGIGTSNYIRRVLARDSGANYQLSVWRNVGWAEFNPPDGVASMALWVKPVDARGGNGWKPVLTDYDACPIVSDHWYRVRVTWDSARPGGIPAQIFVDDQGTLADDTDESWPGYVDCTDADQSQLSAERRLVAGDEIQTNNGGFAIGANINNHANNLFSGWIDWITWSDL